MEFAACSCCMEVYSSNYNTQQKIHANLKAYLAFLDENQDVQEFLAYDICSVFADKYLLAVIFKYFMRLNVGAGRFSKDVFFLALNIAYEVFEDNNMEIQSELYLWSLGTSFETKIREFTDAKMQLFFDLGLRTLVCDEWCESLFLMVPGHFAWQRNREDGHAGARRPVLEGDHNGSYYLMYDRGVCSHCQRRDQLLREMTDVNMNEE